jgi:hypothetical protein
MKVEVIFLILLGFLSRYVVEAKPPDATTIVPDRSMANGVSRKAEQSDFEQVEAYESLKIACEINGSPVQSIVDTGAQISIISTKFAKSCGLYQQLDRNFEGRAVGVGSSNILGKLRGTSIRLGHLHLKHDIAVIDNCRFDFLIGLDVLRKFKSNICLRENMVKLFHQGKVFRIPIQGRSAGLFYEKQQDKNDDFPELIEKETGVNYSYDDEEEEFENNDAEMMSMEGV